MWISCYYSFDYIL